MPDGILWGCWVIIDYRHLLVNSEVKMRRNRCIFCGEFILKSSYNDPFICRTCEKENEVLKEERIYAFLDEGY